MTRSNVALCLIMDTIEYGSHLRSGIALGFPATLEKARRGRFANILTLELAGVNRDS